MIKPTSVLSHKLKRRHYCLEQEMARSVKMYGTTTQCIRKTYYQIFQLSAIVSVQIRTMDIQAELHKDNILVMRETVCGFSA